MSRPLSSSTARNIRRAISNTTFYGPVTLRKALAKSLNVATIKVAEMVGYNTVVNLAHRAGISEDVKATPAMAIGSYDATPLEMAGA